MINNNGINDTFITSFIISVIDQHLWNKDFLIYFLLKDQMLDCSEADLVVR